MNENMTGIGPQAGETGRATGGAPWLRTGCLLVVIGLLLVVAAVFATLWWSQRPITPVVLSPQEMETAKAKLAAVERAGEAASAGGGDAAAGPRAAGEGGAGAGGALPEARDDAGSSGREPSYMPGERVLRLSEREVNGLLNANTDMGQTVRLEFGTDAINAYLALPIPEDFPIGGGRILRARGRLRVGIGGDRPPFAVLEDVTVFGLSLPKAWLADIKGQNLFEQAAGEPRGKAFIDGVKSLKIEPGTLVIEVEE